jgi:hypothetical protein
LSQAQATVPDTSVKHLLPRPQLPNRQLSRHEPQKRALTPFSAAGGAEVEAQAGEQCGVVLVRADAAAKRDVALAKELGAELD